MNKYKKIFMKLVRRINGIGLVKEKVSYTELSNDVAKLFPHLQSPDLYIVVHSTGQKENIFLGVQEGEQLHLVDNLRRFSKTSSLTAEDDKYNLKDFKRVVIINHEQGYKRLIEGRTPEGKTLEFIEIMGQVWSKKV